MKALFVMGLLVLTSMAASADTAADLAKVKHLANQQIMGTDVRKTISVYDNKDGNPCAEDGISYIVKVQTRKAEFGSQGALNQTRNWEDFNTLYISKASLDKGGSLSDSLCGE